MQYKSVGAIKSQSVLDKVILAHTKKNKNIIYGAQSVKKQLGLIGRQTDDYDIFSRQPRKNAIQVTNKLNRIAQAPIYYNTPSKHHKGTYKIYYIGPDGIPYTKDDKGVVDYTELQKGVKYVIINGIRYSLLKNTVKDKKKALADPQYKFRHEKDRNDLNRIQGYQEIKQTPIVRNIL